MKGIIFNTDMVKAVLEDRKTQTRRVIKPQPMGSLIQDEENALIWADCVTQPSTPNSPPEGLEVDYYKCPYGKVGDRLWVKETWAWSGMNRIEYKAFPADGKDFRSVDRWKPAHHMHLQWSRITLEITDIRVERVQVISACALQSDLWKEGLDFHMCNDDESLTDVFVRVWNAMYGKDAWERNDWVWVITFKVVE